MNDDDKTDVRVWGWILILSVAFWSAALIGLLT